MTQGREPKFLGRGWRFPPRFDLSVSENGKVEGTGEVAMVANDVDIQESLIVLFSTFRGERIMLPEYGLGLQEHMFDPTDETSLGHLRSKIEDAILHFEPRIKIEELSFDASRARDGYLMIELDYWIPAINSRSNMVYPFYLKEGTNVRTL